MSRELFPSAATVACERITIAFRDEITEKVKEAALLAMRSERGIDKIEEWEDGFYSIVCARLSPKGAIELASLLEKKYPLQHSYHNKREPIAYACKH
jgi:hypothetical protein